MIHNLLCYNIPNDLRKREYLYYLLEVCGYTVAFPLRDREKWKDKPHLLLSGAVHGSRWTGLVAQQFYGFEVTTDWKNRWSGSYPVTPYETVIKMLEKELKIEK